MRLNRVLLVSMLLMMIAKESLAQCNSCNCISKVIISQIQRGHEVWMGITNEIFDSSSRQSPFYIDFIIRNKVKNQDLCKYLVSRKNCKKLETKDGFQFSLKNQIHVKIKTGMTATIDIAHCCIDTISKDENVPILINKNGSPLYGFNSSQDSQTCLKTITIQYKHKESIIPSSAFSDLFSPNTGARFSYLAPLEVYYDSHNNALYVYLFGYVNYENDDPTYGNTYFAKLIYSLKNGYITRIVSTNSELEEYKCKYSGFIGY